MKIFEIVKSPIFWFAWIIWLGGVFIGMDIQRRVWERKVVINDCGFYHPETARFTWINEAQEE